MCGRVEMEEEGYELYTVVGKPMAREGFCFENSKFVSKVNFTSRKEEEELPPINDMLEALSMPSSALDLQGVLR
uniref:Uncharacterized protein n=1 Tax=Wuchereria bancrofti TaxID=6293 RepID=A0AAF5PI62_WUCBA